MFFLMLQR